jgi:hypothetical protein
MCIWLALEQQITKFSLVSKNVCYLTIMNLVLTSLVSNSKGVA